MRLIRAEEMQAIDQQAINQLGIPGVVLMENAGRAAVEIFCEEYSALFPGPVLIMAGKGNNGGDGYVMARLLAELGWQVETLVLGKEADISGDAEVMLEILRKLELTVDFATDEERLKNCYAMKKPVIVIDALLGTGLKSTVRGLFATAIKLINSTEQLVFAVDIPSGVDGSTGRICGMAVRADLTVTFDHAKIGHGATPGAACAGALEVVDIGIPQRGRPELESKVLLVDADDAVSWLPNRPQVGHKGSFGHLLLIAGSTGKSGAAALAGEAAVRGGCGLVTVGAPTSIHDILEVKLTEAMTVPLADRAGQLCLQAQGQTVGLLADRQALAIGPGLGQSEELSELVVRLLCVSELPTVVDADGLNLLAGRLDELRKRSGPPLVFTPHPGEMSRLCGLSVAEIEANRYQVASRFAAENGVVLLLKGARSIIAAPDGRVCINGSGNDGLASGGSGDVLTGLIGSLLAQGAEPFAAASLAAWLHGRAAELVADLQGTAGMAASDLLAKLPLARQELTEGVYLC